MPVERVLEAAEAEAAAAPNAPVLVSVFLPGGVDLLDTLVPLHEYGRYADLHPKLKVPGITARRRRLRRPPGARGGHRRRCQGPLRARQDRLPAGHRLREPGPVALPLAPLLGDRPDHGRLRAGLARALARPGGRPRQPASGHLDGLGPVAGDALGAGARRGRLLARRRRLLDPRRLGRALRRGDGRLQPARPGTRGGSRALEASRTAARLAKQVADRLEPYRERDGVDPLASTIAYPAESDFGERLRYLAGVVPQPLGIRVADVQMHGDFDTHDNQCGARPAARRGQPVPLRLPGRPRGARYLAARAHVRLVRVRAPAGGERHRDRPRRRRARLGAGRPRACPACTATTRASAQLDEDDNLKVTIDFRRVYSSLLEQWLGTDASAVIPRSEGFGRVQLVR